MATHRFPIDAALPELLAALESNATVLLTAPPGAGKTTRVPPALLDAAWLEGRRIVMLEPRRLAARSAARFMAREMGEAVGETVGYRTRLDTKVSKATRIEVVTEGILTRMIQSDPELADYACVIFDEFHERSLNADLGLALVRESQTALRPELRLLVMSATLAVEPLKALLDDPPLIVSKGRSFPVTVHYRPCPREKQPAAHVAATIRHALDKDSGSLLVLLPGMGESRRVSDLMDGQLPGNVMLCPLHGTLKPSEQDAAIAPAPAGMRKVVLATAIAESSLTIEGIRVVIDAGLQRRSRFDANSGMSRLVTESVSRASSEQRAGRAGRLEPGVCYRLWSESQQSALRAHTPAEIIDADLAPMVLQLAQWGIDDPGGLTWLDLPPQAHWQQAVALLRWLDALDTAGRITAHGRAMLGLGLHPRLAHMVVQGRSMGAGRLAAELAALLSDRDMLGPGAGADMGLRLDALHGHNPRVPRGRLGQARKLAGQIAGKHKGRNDDCNETNDIGRLLVLAFPDRIAQARGGRGRFRLSNGRGAFLFEDDPLAGEDWLVAPELDGQARESRIFLAAAVDPTTLENDLAGHITVEASADWDERRGTVIARQEKKLGALVLESTELDRPDADTVEAGLIAAVRRKGLEALPWNEPARQWQARVTLLHRLWPEYWPRVDDEALLESVGEWLQPFLAGLSRWREVEQLDLAGALNALLDYERQRELARLAPTHLEIPTGRRARIDYTADGGPVLATKLQSVFGWTESPKIAEGRVPVVLHLLSPAQRPLAVTADLSSFWKNAYPEVRKDMRGRYPRHPWPEDPCSARPTEGTTRSGR
jgi:ATP-dependent helicase HrpB